MLHKLFAVFDSSARAFIPPFTLPTEQMAIRVFADCANDPDHHFCKWPNDFCLYEIGSFDDQTGVISHLQEHINHGLAASFQVKEFGSDLPLLDNLEGSN